uniref:Uncharacterized protein n=1 Tax=Romanomermis culicivorax TaxID=13658 RepID=A0A915J883_ROMCU
MNPRHDENMVALKSEVHYENSVQQLSYLALKSVLSKGKCRKKTVLRIGKKLCARVSISSHSNDGEH